MSHASWGQRARLESQNSPCHATGSQSSSQHQKPRCTQTGCNLSEGWPWYSGCCPPWSLLCLLVQQASSLCSFFSLKEGPFHLHTSDSARDQIEAPSYFLEPTRSCGNWSTCGVGPGELEWALPGHLLCQDLGCLLGWGSAESDSGWCPASQDKGVMGMGFRSYLR